MRHTPILGTKVWFGPRGWGGWGWEPVSWEGWAFIPAAVGAIVVIPRWLSDALAQVVVSFVVIAVVLLVCLLKGTSPGGPKAKAEFERLRPFPGGASAQRRLRRNTPDEPSVRQAAANLHERKPAPGDGDGPSGSMAP